MSAATREACWCSRQSRGNVAVSETAAAHYCRECSPEHCRLATLARRCQFGVCSREAEHEVVVSETVDPVQVCGLHVTPVVVWGAPETSDPLIRPLSTHLPVPPRVGGSPRSRAWSSREA